MSDTVVRHIAEFETDKAKAEIKELASSADDLKASVTAAGGALQVAATKADGAATSLGATRAAGANLRAQLMDTAVMLQGGMNPLTILITQGPQAAEAIAMGGGAAKTLTAALGVSLPVIGAVAVGVAALAAGWLYYSSAAEKAEAATAAAAETASKAQKSWEKLRDIQKDVNDQLLVATGKATTADLALRDALQEVADEYGPRIAQEERLLKAAQNRYNAAQKGMQDEKKTGEQLQEQTNIYLKSREEIEKHTKALSGLQAEQAKLQGQVAQGLLIEPPEKPKTSTEEGWTPEKAAMSWISGLQARGEAIRAWATDAEAQIAGAVAEIEAYEKAVTSAQEELQKAADAGLDPVAKAELVYQRQVAAIEKAGQLYQDQALIAQALAGAEKTRAETLQRIADEQKRAAEEAERAARAQKMASINAAFGAITNPLGALGSTGPAGAIIAGTVGAGGAFADRSNSATDQLRGQLEAFTEGIKNIGAEFKEFILYAAKEFVPELLKSLPTLVVELAKVLANPEFWFEVIQGLVSGLVDAIKDALNPFNNKQNKKRHSGGVIQQEDWYYLDRGETVSVPGTRTMDGGSGGSSRVGSLVSGSNGRVTIEVSSADFVRAFNRSSGRGLSFATS